MSKKLLYTVIGLVLCAVLLVFVTDDEANGDHCLVYPEEPCEMPRHCYFPPFSEGYNDGSCPGPVTETTTTTVPVDDHPLSEDPVVTTPTTTEPVVYPHSDLPITG